jgi:hypothetical protein
LVAQKRARLQTILAERAAWASPLMQVKRMHGWVLEADHLLDGSWAEPGEVVSNATVAHRLDAWREQMATLLTEGTLSELERQCLSEFLQVLSNEAPVLGAVLRPQGLSAHRTPRWSAAFAASKRSIAASVVARTGTRIYCATDALWLTPLGGSKMAPIASSSSSELVSLTVPAGANCDGRPRLPTASN